MCAINSVVVRSRFRGSNTKPPRLFDPVTPQLKNFVHVYVYEYIHSEPVALMPMLPATLQEI